MRETPNERKKTLSVLELPWPDLQVSTFDQLMQGRKLALVTCRHITEGRNTVLFWHTKEDGAANAGAKSKEGYIVVSEHGL
jgi:hypothetical protein